MVPNYIRSLAFFSTIPLSLFATNVLADGPNGEQCGPANGGASCGLNICCSSAGYCGTTSDYCDAGCQSAFGSCQVPTPPSCDPNGGSASGGRKVGYWQVQQVHDRTCDVMTPADIPTAGLTHIIFSFAHIDASTFAIIPANQDDVQYYTQFTDLKSSSLQTWIAIGGGGFSTATWTAAAATESSRAAFVSSLQQFINQYGFQGVDLDWEFPAADGSDAQNFVALAKAIKDTIGVPISAAVPADWGSVRGFDLDGLSNYVDWFNFMAYDIHGWGIDQPPAQSAVSYPADIQDIDTLMLPVWANMTDPSQVNLGMPLYGRGYTLASADCSTEGCEATGPSAPGQCAADPSGVMSLDDFQRIQESNAVTVVLDQDALQKRATWGNNQWLGYDDSETIALKTTWANGRCLGGTFFWALDFESDGVNGNAVHIAITK